jgi:hypothetical protein
LLLVFFFGFSYRKKYNTQYLEQGPLLDYEGIFNFLKIDFYRYGTRVPVLSGTLY